MLHNPQNLFTTFDGEKLSLISFLVQIVHFVAFHRVHSEKETLEKAKPGAKNSSEQ